MLLSCYRVSGKLAFLHDGYIVTIENCCVPIAVKRKLFSTRVASLVLGTSFNSVFATHVMLLLLGASFNMEL